MHMKIELEQSMADGRFGNKHRRYRPCWLDQVMQKCYVDRLRIIADEWYQCGKPEPRAGNAVTSVNYVDLEILSNASVALLWNNRGVLNPCISSGRHVSNDRLPATITPIAVGPMLRHTFVVE